MASSNATAIASPKAREAVVLVVGARSKGQASFDIPVYLDQYDTTLSTELAISIDREECHWDSKRYNWLTYNLFDWNHIPAVKYLSEKIYRTYVEYNNELGNRYIPKDQLWIRGWGVVMTEGNSIGHHSHAFHENSYISGNLSLSQIGTTTDYYFPYLGWYFGYWKVTNTIGGLAMFPSWLEHKVDPITDVKLDIGPPKVRYTVAFDMFTPSSMEYARENRNENSETQNSQLLSKLMSEI